MTGTSHPQEQLLRDVYDDLASPAGEEAMSRRHYRLYKLNKHNKITEGEDIFHPDDDTALMAAEAIGRDKGCAVEVWERTRLVGRISEVGDIPQELTTAERPGGNDDIRHLT